MRPILLLMSCSILSAGAAPVFEERFEPATARSLHGGASLVPARPPRPEGAANQVLEIGKSGEQLLLFRIYRLGSRFSSACVEY